jgi:hypothetical protein
MAVRIAVAAASAASGLFWARNSNACSRFERALRE